MVKGNILTFEGVTDVTDCKTAEEALHKAKLDFTVAKGECFVKMPGQVDFDNPSGCDNTQFFNGANSFKPANNAYCTYRTDKNIPLGLVKQRYTPVQNVDAFKFFNDVIGENEVTWFTAGNYGNGERVFISAKLTDNVLVNGKDPIDIYLIFSNTHDSSQGVRIMLTPIRLICFNCMNAAIRNSSNYITFRHTNNVNNRFNQAKEILQITRKQIDVFADAMEYLSKIKLTDDDAMYYFSKCIMSDKEMKDLEQYGFNLRDISRRNFNAMDAANISTQKVNQFCDMINYYHMGAGQREYLGTGYGVYNAVNGYYSNVYNQNGIKRMDNLIYGTQSDKIKDTADLIIKQHG